MADYKDSSQFNLWLFQSPDEIEQVRSLANKKARIFLSNDAQNEDQRPPVEHFACGFSKRSDNLQEPQNAPSENPKGHPYLTSEEEQTLVTFYVNKLPILIGPSAQVSRLRRESKVTATAAMLTRRFFLSNSVMLHDPKIIMVAAAFLGAKVEDATADIRYLEQGTQLMNAPVTQQDIVPAELNVLSGCHFDLLCFHPYKPVLALTEDLRTYLKSDKGKNLVDCHSDRPLSGNDLLPIYDTARTLFEKVILSDIPLLYSPAKVGLAALMVAQEEVLAKAPTSPKIDFAGYLKQRFDDEPHDDDPNMLETLEKLCVMLRNVKETPEPDMTVLKGVHKKLKKVRVWGQKESKKKKRSGDDKEGLPEAKKQKTG